MTIRKLFKDRVLTISNVISLSRGIIAPVVAYLFYVENRFKENPLLEYAIVTLIVYIILSDFFDGFLARHLKQETALGRFLDPIADKITLIFVGSALCYYRSLPLWFLVFMIARDIITISCATFLFSRKDIEVKPNLLGKSCVAIIALSGILYAAEINWEMNGIPVKLLCIVITTFLCTTSSVWYASLWIFRYETRK
jgi:CDP-diacylglycerol--glycerol-3-phosphate 3-phosphatidyltransferase